MGVWYLFLICEIMLLSLYVMIYLGLVGLEKIMIIIGLRSVDNFVCVVEEIVLLICGYFI